MAAGDAVYRRPYAPDLGVAPLAMTQPQVVDLLTAFVSRCVTLVPAVAPLPAYVRFAWFDLDDDDLAVILEIVPGLNVRRDLQGLRRLLQCL